MPSVSQWLDERATSITGDIVDDGEAVPVEQ